MSMGLYPKVLAGVLENPIPAARMAATISRGFGDVIGGFSSIGEEGSLDKITKGSKNIIRFIPPFTGYFRVADVMNEYEDDEGALFGRRLDIPMVLSETLDVE